MAPDPLGLALLFALAGGAVFYWMLVLDRVRERRVNDRLRMINRGAAVMRAHLAEQRRPA